LPSALLPSTPSRIEDFLFANEISDYFHIARRFGIVGVSQFPIQYLLASKRVNPAGFAFGTSHEDINRWHRILGWISYLLILLHGTFYLNSYYQNGGLGAAFLRLVPVLGMLGLFSMTILSATTLSAIRRYSYRVFFVTHLFVVLAVPCIISFHVPHGRDYMAESLLILLVDMAARRLAVTKSLATIETVPGTNLIKVVATLPSWKIRDFAAHPALHTYLSIPRASRPGRNPWSWSHLRLNLLSNPFTAASVKETTGELTLVARQMNGPTTNTIAALASLPSPDTQVSLNVDGPYGVSAHFPDLAGPSFDKVLLVAGGIGATCLLPLYEHIITKNPASRVQLVWAVRDANELTWPDLEVENSIYEDDRIHLFVTGNRSDSASGAASSLNEFDDVELSLLEEGHKRTTNVPVENHKRPDLQRIVDEVFQQDSHDRVAVVVCGPAQMAGDLREAVGIWIKMGRDAWFHSESFSW
jgi:NAD(P)H-flavin reductase